MQHEDWRVLMQWYHGTALCRVRDASSDTDIEYWKRVAHELKQDMDSK